MLISRLKSTVTEDDWFDEEAWLTITGAIAGGIWGSVLLPGVGTITSSIVEAVHGGFYGVIIGSAY